MLKASSRKVIHIDADCFFAAIEMRDNPDFMHRPLAVGGAANNRGVIATCNYPARAYGIHSAMSTAQALKQCPSLQLVPTNMPLYREVSEDLMAILQTHSYACEVVSIDEAYLAIEPSKSAIKVAQQIKQEVKQQLGISVSAGVASNKLLAKIASDLNKPDGLSVILPKQIDTFMQTLSVQKIPGVGKRFTQKLSDLNIHTCAEAQTLSLDRLIKQFGKAGWLLYQRCRGIDERAVLSAAKNRKSISLEQTFSQDISAEEMLEKVPELWQKWQQRVIQKKLDHTSLAPFVKIKFSDFRQTTYADSQLTSSQENVQKMLKIASQRRALPIRLIGIGGRIEAYNQQQLELF